MPVLALADVAAIAFALVCMLAVFLLGKLIVAVIPDIHIPLVGNLKTKVNGWFATAMHGLTDALDAVLGGTATAIHQTIHFFAWFGRGIAGIAAESYATMSHIIGTIIPREVGKALHYAESKVAALAKTVAHDLSVAERYTLSHVATLTKALAADVTRVEHYALAHVESLAKTVAADLSKAESYAISEADKAEATAKAAAAAALSVAVTTLNNAIVTVEQTVAAFGNTLATDITDIDAKIGAIATGSIAGVIGAIDGDITGASEEVWGDITAAAGALGATIGTDFADVRKWLDSISSTAVGDIAGVTTLAIASVGIITRLAEDCIVPQCRNLSGLGNLLQDLFGALESGALLAFLAELAADPQQAANDVESILGPIANDAVSTARELLSI